ncbi:MAG TPA: CaiB/BaiF CoA-transferase family protein [Casimicrobiaceae bacterium]|nr:CaiB/BaiF CoA-transferase family protein [Casimicrobiaceae bacterium]
MRRTATGPLAGVRILELEAIGPVPFCGMMLADMGADVLLVDRPGDSGLGLGGPRACDIMFRGRRSITLDLKRAESVDVVLDVAERADALIEGFRPGVLERLGLGPRRLHERNAKLVIGRGTGWGQQGPLASRAGHDINYIALTGALHAIGRAGQKPVPPLNLIGDFGGGGMLLAYGVVCALLEARSSGRGQVVDAAMIDGASLLTTMFWGVQAAGQWSQERGTNVLDSGAPWYDVYETADAKYVAIGAIEPKFYAEMLKRLNLSESELPRQHDPAGWPALRARFTAVFRSRTRDEWSELFAGSDACFAPVLAFDEAASHRHAAERGAHATLAGVLQPAPAPRFSRTREAMTDGPPERGAKGREALRDWGFNETEIAQLVARGAGIRG